MVNTTSDTFDQQFHALKDKYKEVVPAEALFWKRWHGGSSYEYGLRIQAPTIMKEFIDNVNLGTDPQGFLFFNNIHDLDAGDGKYNIFYNTVTDVKQRAATVQLFHSHQGSFYAEFLARDPNKTVNYTIDSQAGKWATLEIGSASALVKKYSDETTITVTIPAIKKKATFEVKDNSGKQSADVWGSLSFKTLESLKSSSTATYADYNKDRIIFYPQSGGSGSADFSAAFIPMDTAPVDALGDLTFEANTVYWSDL